MEIELQLVDARTMALRSAIAEVLAGLPPALHDSVKPEFLQCYVELNTSVCRTAAEVEADLAGTIRAVEGVAADRGLRLLWAATHPFSRWREQQITPNARYYKLADQLRETVVRPVTFGLHVHVGLDSGDKAIEVSNRLVPYLPLLLALSADSPFWHGRQTGHQAHRLELLEVFPTGGLPPRMRGWDDYAKLVETMVTSGCIASTKELWWDVRPSHENGTLEVRICDMPADLEGVIALTALVQCLVHDLSRAIDRGEPAADWHPLVVQQNRWRACRYGLGAELVDGATLASAPARGLAESLVGRLRAVASELGCARELERAGEMAAGPTGAERQVALWEETGDLVAMTRAMADRSTLLPAPAAQGPEPWGRDPLGPGAASFLAAPGGFVPPRMNRA